MHLGIDKAPCRSTLSYANEHRPAALFEELFWTVAARFRQQQALGGKRHKFRFKNKLRSLDSTTISLCLSLFPWAKFRRAKGGVKAPVLLDHDDYLPVYVLLTNLLEFGATTIAAIYKERWQIELFFKALKQNLTVKTFVGTSENAVKTQIWIAVSVYVLVAIIRKRLELAPSLYQILQVLSVTLFEKTPVLQALQASDSGSDLRDFGNQLNLFNL